MTKRKEFSFTGGEQLADDLKHLGDAVSARLVMRSMANAAEVIREAASAAAPADKGILKNNIVKQGKYAKSRNLVLMLVGLRRNALKTAGVDVYYGRFVEFGTKNQRPQPFLRPAFFLHKAAFVDILVGELRPRVNRAIAKLKSQKSGG